MQLSSGSDIRTLQRAVGAFSLVAAPLCAVAAFAVTPIADASWSTQRILAATAAHPGQARLANWLATAFGFLLVPAILAAMRLAKRQAPVLATISGGLALIAWLGVFTLNAIDTLAYELTRTSVPSAAAADIYDRVTASAPVGATVGIFVAGHILGTVGLGLALLRARAIAAWAAAAVVAATPVPLVAHFAGSRPLDLVSWSLLALGFAAVAVSVLRTANEEWDVTPAVLEPSTGRRSLKSLAADAQ
jgi:hypothetical protein